MKEFCAQCGKELISEICDCQSVKDEEIQSQAEEVVEEPIEEVMEESTEETTEESVEETAEEPVEETTEEPVEEAEEEVKHPEEDSKMKKFAIKVGEKASDIGIKILNSCKKIVKKNWEYDKKVGKKMLDILISPASEIAAPDKELSVSFTIGAVFVVFIFITHLINPLFIGYGWEWSLKLGLALWIALIPLTTILVATMIVYLFSKKEGERVAFEEILAAFCVASAPSTIFYIIGYVLSFKWSVAMVICLFFAIISWVLLSVEVTSHMLEERNRTYWVMFLITILTTIIIAVCGTEIITDIVTKVLIELNAYIQEVRVELKDIMVEMINGLF